MEKHSLASTWQDLLAELIDDTQEKTRLATALSVEPITLTRWAKRTARPRERNMHNLLNALPPSHSQAFLRLAVVEFPTLHLTALSEHPAFEALPSEFYAQILQAYTSLPLLLGQQTIYDLFCQQAIAHLDPERRGMAITLATCVRPLEGQVVRSLREVGGIGTPPWKRDLEQKTILLGAESLAGYALTNFRRVIVPNRADPTRVPVHWTEHEQSAIAIPIARHARLCGCLLASSVVPNYFHEGQASVHLLEHYANLATLLFEAKDFYGLSAIQLNLMPAYETQLPYFQQVNSRIQQQFCLAPVRGEPCSLEQARHQVWREIEEELILAFLQKTSTP
jgi:hypothetical protein